MGDGADDQWKWTPLAGTGVRIGATGHSAGHCLNAATGPSSVCVAFSLSIPPASGRNSGGVWTTSSS